MEIDLYHGKCRCCHTKGNHRDIMKEYNFNGAREMYSDIFIECFNLFLSADSRLTTLICQSCIRQLKDAYAFKTNVIDIESQLLKSLKTIEGNNTVLFEDNNIKEEIQVIKEEFQIDEADISLTDYSTGEDVAVEEETACEDDAKSCVDDVVMGESELLEKYARDSTPLPTRLALRTTCPGLVRHLECLEGKIITARMIEALLTKPQALVPASIKRPQKVSASLNKHLVPTSLNKPTLVRARRKPKTNNRKKVTKTTKVLDNTDEEGYLTDEDTDISPAAERLGHAVNISNFLKHSNVTAFMSKFKHGYPCFYCKGIYEDFDLLRKHQKEHSIENLQNFILTQYRSPDSLVVNVDVTDLKCTLCGDSIPSLKELKSHLINVHMKVFDLRLSDRVIPFKMANELVCQVCSCNFETFGALERHMSTHFRHYACKICGAGFISKKRLKIHTGNVHVRYPQDKSCDICKKVFPSQRKYKIHYDLVHMMAKKVPCPKCPARFSYYYVRQKHLEDVHGEKPVTFKCNVCEKEYKRRYLLSVHIKKEHLNQRLNCEICAFTSDSSMELERHLVKQHKDSIEIFECHVCKKPFASQKTLKKHTTAHNTYTCDVCGQKFKQKNYLIGHLKTHINKEIL